VSLRARLVLSFTAMLLVVIVAVGLVASRSVKTILVAQIDQTLVGFSTRQPGPGQIPLPGPGFEFDGQQSLSPIAGVVIDADGQIVASRPSGFSDDPDPLPNVTNLPDNGEPFYLASADGALEYRGIVVALPDGLSLVLAEPLTEVNAAVAALLPTMFLAGAGVLLLGAAATLWMVQLFMRPVDQMVQTAEAIAAGDLTRRVPQLESGTELGRLGDSLNEMLGTIEEAVGTEREAQERLRRFVADASHELRTPLSVISGYAELRRKGGLADADDEDNAWSRVDKESQRMAALVEDLLTLARLGQSQRLDLSSFDLVEAARTAAKDHEVIDPSRPVSVVAQGAVTLVGDENRIHQALANLLSNVRSHTPPGTMVDIEIEAAGDDVHLSVSDDGPGFGLDAANKLFDPFYRSDPSRSRSSGGSGLGLAIVDAIVTAHGGSVTARNGEQGGAVVAIDLPTAPKSG
jgi:two-component system, OmpR family, sensor kinase